MQVTEMFDRFKAALFVANVNQFAPQGTDFLRFFPSQYSPTLKTEVLQFDTSPNVAGDIVAFDSRIENKGRETPGSITVGIPKIAVSRYKTETDYLRYLQLSAMANAMPAGQARTDATNQILRLMYEDGPFAVSGVNAKLEWTAKQIASLGSYSLTADVNAGGVVTKKDIAFGLPSGNIVTAAKPWADPATSTPITDFSNRAKAARTAGYRLTAAIMDRDTFNLFARSEEVQKFCTSYLGVALGLLVTPTVSDVNTALNAQDLPNIVIWDTYVSLEKKDGTRQATTGWNPGSVIFAETSLLGTTRYATTVDAQIASQNAVVTNNGFITVKAYAEENPIKMTTFGAAYATPVLENVKRKFILKTAA